MWHSRKIGFLLLGTLKFLKNFQACPKYLSFNTFLKDQSKQKIKLKDIFLQKDKKIPKRKFY
jgi:hypothetical protein